MFLWFSKYFSDSGIEDERETDKNELKDETSLTDEQTKSQKSETAQEDENNDDDEKWMICPCWKCCPGLGILPPSSPEKFTVLSTLKLIGQWVSFS